jgi:hypothetical protein
LTEKNRQRFLSKFKQGTPDECWEWIGSTDIENYGIVKWNKKRFRAHRISYELFKGEIPKGLCVCHSCDNPKCVNPNHLWVGTIKENNTDRTQKGRNADRKGEKHPMFGKVGCKSPTFGLRRFGENNPNFGNKWTQEQKDNQSEKLKNIWKNKKEKK